ncbi:MAG: hypothetical protein HQM09_04295 [Candidatus Riflebacteria bacterium]|nr:hypothetical protein [Candidatus Riflebacteria bacterium]
MFRKHFLMILGMTFLVPFAVFAGAFSDDDKVIAVPKSGIQLGVSHQVSTNSVIQNTEESPLNKSPEALVDYYLQQAKGDSKEAWHMAYDAREKFGWDKTNLRNVEHYFYARQMAENGFEFPKEVTHLAQDHNLNLSVPLNSVAASYATMVYSLAKVCGWQKKNSPPTVEELAWGLKGVRDGLANVSAY